MPNQNPFQQRLDSIEADMQKLLDENTRLIRDRESAYVELDSWVSLLAKLAVQKGLSAGLANPTTFAMDLESGQVSWEFAESEAHLFEELPAYEKPLEVMENREKYRRIMNPGF